MPKKQITYYTPNERAYYVQYMNQYIINESDKPPYREIERKTGVHEANLRRWWKEKTPEQLEHNKELNEKLRSDVWKRTKLKLSDRAQHLALKLSETLEEVVGDPGAMRSARDGSIAFATLVDKTSHLEGDPIGRFAVDHKHQHVLSIELPQKQSLRDISDKVETSIETDSIVLSPDSDN